MALLELGLNPEGREAWGDTAVRLAAVAGHWDTVIALIGAGAVCREDTVKAAAAELPLGHCPPGSTLLGFNTTQTQHFLSLTFNTPHIKQSRIQQ